MAALLVVLIVGAAGLIMAKGAAFLSIGGLDMAKIASQANSSQYSAESCLEEALIRIKRDNDYSADNLQLSLGNGACSASVADTGSGKEILISGGMINHDKYLKAVASTSSGEIVLDVYSETED